MELQCETYFDLLGKGSKGNSPPFSSYHFDSREVVPGGLFFALKGARSDGHLFLAEVAKRGAVGAVVDCSYRGSDYGLTLFFVEDVQKALQALAKKTIGNTFIVAITGSVGKTTTKEFVSQLLSFKFRVGKSEKNQNSQVGLPLTLLNRQGGEEILVLEMGMSQPGEIARLVELAPPDLAAITKIDLVHAENFPSGEEGIFVEKSQIFSSHKTTRGIYPLKWKGHLKKPGMLTFSCLEQESDFSVREGFLFFKDRQIVASPFNEAHFTEDFFLAASIATLLGMTPEEISQASSKLELPKMRFQKLENDGIVWILDSYNACYASMRAALVSLPPAKRKIAVLGEMRELGTFSKDVHRKVGEVAVEHVDLLLCLGEGAREYLDVFTAASKPGIFFETKEELEAFLYKEIASGDLVLIKGSRALGMETLMSRLKSVSG